MGCVFSASQANSLESDTGDVRFICLERLSQVQPSQPSPNVISTPRRPGSAASTSSYSAFSTELTARKRVIYAHSDIISRRSEYFATMLSSSFSEVGTGPAPGERKVYTITVEEADFETIYWLLKWVYGNWLLFKEHDDPRAAVDGVGEGWSARWLNARGGEWDWKTFRKSNLSDGSITGTRDDARSVASADSETDKLVGGQDQSPVQSSTTPTASSVRAPPVVRTTSSSKTIPVPANPGNVSRQISTPPRRSGTSTSASTLSMTAPPGRSTTKTIPVPITLSNSNFPGSGHYAVSQRQHPHLHPTPATNTIDPHLHPTPAPQPASALSMYQVAHRYAMPGLTALALEHMMSTMTPQSSFPLLLATSVWDELRSLVEVCSLEGIL